MHYSMAAFAPPLPLSIISRGSELCLRDDSKAYALINHDVLGL